MAVSSYKELEGQEKRARETAEDARLRISELEERRRRLSLEVLLGRKGAPEKLEALEAEIADLTHRAELAELAAEELRVQLGDALKEAEAEELRRRREVYDGIVHERGELLERVEEGMAELTHRLNALLTHEEQRRAAWRALGYPDPATRPYADVLQERIAHQLADFLPGMPQSRTPLAMQALTLTDDVMPLAEMEEARETSTSRSQERAAEQRRQSQVFEVQQELLDRRHHLLSQLGITPASNPQRVKEAERRVDAQLAQEFPQYLTEKGA